MKYVFVKVEFVRKTLFLGHSYALLGMTVVASFLHFKHVWLLHCTVGVVFKNTSYGTFFWRNMRCVSKNRIVRATVVMVAEFVII